ncbi:MAG: biotin--[acetyl-CoA-carboxylase] ligase [Flavobacteriaceae bacterium]|jgi:BirA family biotin operon repressor/biotin-[acetyl-CoA-carboxylase] ligase|nr:biotin--[acetyl-CoA-carboxylase] ligase [Flavobacteriaceae bacterium]
MSYFNTIKLDATASSNDWLKNKYLKGDCSDGDVVWVRNQTQGRGQRDKLWQTEPMKNLTFSLFKLFPELTVENAFAINCAVTLGVTKALSEVANIDFMLKWPNDILSGNNKIGGVLIENTIKGNRIIGSIIGIGININQARFDGLPQASSLFLKTGVELEIGDVLNRILAFLEVYFNRLSTDSSAALKLEYEAMLFQKGKSSTFKDQKEKFQGVIKGITDKGLLRIQKTSGEVLNYPHGAIEIIF